jgi:predicted small integral membrane protein
MSFVGFFGLLLIFSNLTDYSSNLEYVGHVLSMDTVSENNTRRYRAITSPLLHHRVYWAFITLEVTFTLSCLIGTYQLYKHINGTHLEFHEAKQFSIVGLMIGIFIYYVCLQIIGIEWFDMDESSQWNVLQWSQSTLNVLMFALVFLVLKIE